MALDILAILVDPATARTCLDAAAAAAAITKGRIEAFHARATPMSLILPTEEVMTPLRRAELEHFLVERSASLQGVVEAWRAEHRQEVVWREATSDNVAATVAARGGRADLIVIARPTAPEGDEALHAAIFATGRLLLFAPTPPAMLGRHIAVAWNASPQAKRAVVASLPWLRRADRVFVLASGVTEQATEWAAKGHALLARHKISASVAVREDGGGAGLLAEAHALGADCLVMGAYRRGPMLEAILGGVTHHVLTRSDLPAFMLH
jgi:nucleotide-binding universal stress UspA family protein